MPAASLRLKQPLLQLTQQFNDMAILVASSIVCACSLAERAALISRWVEVASLLRQIRNFNGTFVVLAGLSNTAVHRLRATRARLSKQTLAEWDSLVELMAHKQSYRAYRSALRSCLSPNEPRPYLPYMGVHLTDLTFIGDGNADRVGSLINVSKRQKVLDVISLCLAGRCARYEFSALPGIGALVDAAKRLSEDALYRESLQREPRGMSVTEIERRDAAAAKQRKALAKAASAAAAETARDERTAVGTRKK